MALAEYGSQRASEMRETDFLGDGGELGERIRHHDWAATPLGPLRDWPQPLRAAVSLCVRSQFPIIIHWGWPDLVVLYNDAFIPMIGDRDPSALGRPVFESCPELRPTLASTMEKVQKTGQSVTSNDVLHFYRRGEYLEERYYTLSSSAIELEPGKVGGAMSLVDNTTDRVVGERRLQTLRELVASSHDARELEEACRIAGDVLDHNRYDIPFALFYLVDKEHQQARLAAGVGLAPGGKQQVHRSLT